MDRRSGTRHNLHTSNTRSSDSVLGDDTGTWSSNTNDARPDHDYRVGHKFNLRLYTVACLALVLTANAAPALAETTGNNIIANPQATSSGQAVNQAIQVTGTNNFQQTYGGGIQCQTSTLAISPFSIQGWTYPDAYTSNDIGVAATVSFPLDGGAVELCKEAARTQISRQQAEADKAALDYNIVRALKCSELIRGGAFLHPASPYADLCRDVIALGEDGLFRNGVGQVIRSSSSETSSRRDN